MEDWSCCEAGSPLPASRPASGSRGNASSGLCANAGERDSANKRPSRIRAGTGSLFSVLIDRTLRAAERFKSRRLEGRGIPEIGSPRVARNGFPIARTRAIDSFRHFRMPYRGVLNSSPSVVNPQWWDERTASEPACIVFCQRVIDTHRCASSGWVSREVSNHLSQAPFSPRRLTADCLALNAPALRASHSA